MTTGLPLILSDEASSYIYGPGGVPVEQINSSTGTVTYLHHDQAGSTRLLTGSTGTVTGKCTYSAYGVPICEGTTITLLGYDGQYTSSDTGLIYLRARVYDPVTAQFLSRDAFTAVTGEPYAYAGDNPLSASDPTGLDFFEEAAEGIAGWGDALTLGGTKWIREELGINNINTCSAVYQAGGLASLVTAVIIPGEGEGALAEEGGAAIEAEITGFTRHGLAQAISREGVGVNEQAMLDAVNAPVKVINQADGTTRFVGKDATVVLNGEGRVVTTWANGSAGTRIQP